VFTGILIAFLTATFPFLLVVGFIVDRQAIFPVYRSKIAQEFLIKKAILSGKQDRARHYNCLLLLDQEIEPSLF